MGLSWLAAIIAIAALLLVIVDVVIKAAPAISWDFLTQLPSTSFLNPSGGGIVNSIVGSAILIGLSSLISIPIAILVAIYTTEFAPPPVASVIRFALDILNGVPTIVTGIFIYGILVLGHQQSGWAGAVALAIVQLPIVARAAQEVLALVPTSLKEAGLALGLRRWRIVTRVVLPTAAGGLADHRRRARHRPGGRGDRAAAVHDLGVLQPHDRHPIRIRRWRTSRSRSSPCRSPPIRSREGVGGGAGADRVRAGRLGGRPDLERPQPPQAWQLT